MTMSVRTQKWFFAGVLLAAGVLFFYAGGFVALLLSAVLVAVFLWALTDWLSRHTGLAWGWALLAVILVCMTVLGLTGWLLAPEIGRQVQRLAEELPKAWNHFEAAVKRQPWGQQVEQMVPSWQDLTGSAPEAFNKASGVLSSTFGALANVLIVLIIGIYFAADPRRYWGGAIRLLPPSRRDRAGEVVGELGTVLKHWLLGRFVLMAINAIATSFGLWLLGVPLAITLGLLAGALNFVPNLGPIVAAIPAVLLGFLVGPWTALYVAFLYLGYQTLDGYVLTPLVQKKTVSLPPALILIAQIALGLVWGVIGVLLAVPVAAIVLVLIKMLYIEDVLGERVEAR